MSYYYCGYNHNQLFTEVFPRNLSHVNGKTMTQRNNNDKVYWLSYEIKEINNNISIEYQNDNTRKLYSCVAVANVTK